MKNKDIINAFIEGQEEKVKNLFCKRDSFGRMVLFSYGEHFPLALKLDDCFVVNGNKYSQTTSCHQGILNRAIKGQKIIMVDTQKLKEIIGTDGKNESELIEVNI